MQLRGKVYYSCFRAHGRQVRKRLSSNFDTACRMLVKLRSRADEADFGLLDNDCALADLREAWERQCRLTLRDGTIRRYRQNLNKILGGIAVHRVSQLSADVVNAYREVRLAKASPRTVNMEVTALSTMLRWAVDAKYIGYNPLSKIKGLQTKGHERKERRALTADEVQRLIEASPDYLRPVWRMFLTTGIRKGELAAMLFADVDFERGTLTVRAATAKTKKSREIPLDDDMLATIKWLRDEAPFRRPGKGVTSTATERIEAAFSKEHVFVTKAGTPWRNNLLMRFYAVCAKAGIEGARRPVRGRGKLALGAKEQTAASVDIHSLRVTFATLAIEGGASPKAVQEILGHSTLELTMSVYSKATDRAKRAAVSALPFAKATAPAHVIPMEGEHKLNASNSGALQVVAG